MATVKFELLNKDENAQIFLRLSVKRGLTPRRKTGKYISYKNWSFDKKLPKQNNPENKTLTIELKNLASFVLKKTNNATSDGTTINGDWLQHQIDLFFKRVSENNNSELVTDSIQNIINTAHIRENGKGGIGLSKCRINSYKRLSDLFIEFQKDNDYTIPQLNKSIFDNFKRWLLDNKKYSPTYSLKKLSDLKTVCKDAKSNGIEISPELNDIKTRQISAYDDDMDVIILSEEEIAKIEKIELTRESLVNARKWLILACYTGQRGQALTTRIKKGNFEKYGSDLVIKFRQKKGNKSVIIPVLPKVKEIYDNGLPYTISLTKLNKHFKEIGKIAELNTPTMGRIIEAGEKGKKRGIKKLRPKYKYISTHIGRRTFASNHYGKIPTPIIMRVTGHSKESTFLGYINQTDDSHIDTFLDYYKTKELKEKKEPQLSIIKNASNE
jgi:integrase